MMPLCVVFLFSQICWRLFSQHPTYISYLIEKWSKTQKENLVHKETEVLQYATMVPRGTRHYVACHTSCIPASAYFTLKLPLSYPQVLLYFLAATSSPPVTSAGIPSDGLHTNVRAWEYRGIPKASSDVTSRSSGNHGYIRNGMFFVWFEHSNILRKFFLLLLFYILA